MIGVMAYTLFRLLHFAALILFAGALVIENMAIKPSINREDAHNLARVDLAAGAGAVLSFLFGLILWLWVGKPAQFYSANPVFHAKLVLFFAIVLLAMYPARFFFRHAKTEQDSLDVPVAVRRILRLELILLLIMPLLATLMARGIGLPG